MVVDDDPIVIRTLRAILKQDGFGKITSASNGKEVLDITKSILPDLIILDAVLPQVSGFEVFRKLKQNARTQAIPVLMMSGYHFKPGRLKEYEERKPLPWITKPFNLERLYKWVNSLL